MAIETRGSAQVQEFVLVLSKRRWQILLPTAFVLALGSAFAVIVPKKFPVTTRIELRETSVDVGRERKTEVEAAPINEIQAAEQHIRHFHRIEGVIQAQGRLWPEYVGADELERNDFVKQVLANLFVKTIEKKKNEGSSFVDITYTDVDGARAVEFLRELTKAWINDVIERNKNDLKQERNVLRERTNAARKEYGEKNQQYSDLAKEMGLDPTQPIDSNKESRGDPFFRDLEAHRSQREAATIELARAKAEMDELKRTHAAEPPEISRDVKVAGTSFAPEIATAESALAALQARLARLKPAHYEYHQLRDQIDALEQKIAQARALETPDRMEPVQEPNPHKGELLLAVQSKEAEVRGVERELEALANRVGELERLTQRRTDDFKVLVELDQARLLARTALTDVSAHLANKETELDIVNSLTPLYEVAQEPRASKVPTEPSPTLIVLFSLLAGLALGLFVALVAESARDSYRTAHELGLVLSVPVLGTINRIRTRHELRAEQLRRSLVGASSAVVLGGIAWLTYLLATSPEKLPLEVQKAVEGLRQMLM
jgi:uncharacterized protein involved in exopolysaccharide biosynthesis